MSLPVPGAGVVARRSARRGLRGDNGGSGSGETSARPRDDAVRDHADALLESGRAAFRFDTFGDEVFWGDTLQLHRTVAGAANGGIGPGLSRRRRSSSA